MLEKQMFDVKGAFSEISDYIMLMISAANTSVHSSPDM